MFEWRIQGSISEADFSELYKMWNKKSYELLTAVMSEDEFRDILSTRIKDLDLMMGILINEQNRVFEECGCKREWLQCVEHLFFILDSQGSSYITMDGTKYAKFVINICRNSLFNNCPAR